ncbi:MAG: hypothetical protein KDD45_01635 [Bdellovibrionales bacterium]|nr:hypothetical protein [Bdellovibrionales bacterium]
MIFNKSGLESHKGFDFFSRAVFMLGGLILLFQFFRFYLFQNLVLTSESVKILEIIKIFWWGFRFDLCVIGFLLIPIFLVFILSLSVNQPKLLKYIFGFGFLYIAIIYILTLLIYYFNLPFFIKNSGFGLPYWMRWEDYQSLWQLNKYPTYWHYNYVAEFHSYQLMLIILFSCLLSLFIIPVPTLKFKKPKYTILAYFFIIALMARGKLGQYHLRFEDSRFSKNPIINDLSLNPLWLIDKSKEQLSQD